MKIKLSELNSNPFKKHVNDGKLNQDRIDMLKESIDHGTLPEYFTARKHNGKYELASGHHRASALKSVKGSNYEVEVGIVDFSDEQMLIDMVRENITQRDTDFHDTRGGIVLARDWLQSGETTVKSFDGGFVKHKGGISGKGVYGSKPQPDSFKSIAKFLSKNGKAVSHQTVSNYLKIHDRLSPKLLAIVEKQDHATSASGKKDKKTIGVKDAIKISTITDNWDEQEDLVEALKNTREQHGNDKQTNLTIYKNAPEEIKKQVRNGELDLADVEDAMLDKDIKEFNEKNPRWEFIPNFAGRLRQFDKDVFILEKQVKAFSMVFHDKRFTEKYDTLKPKQQLKLNELISNISRRVKKCYEEVDFFKEILDVPTNGTILKLKEE